MQPSWQDPQEKVLGSQQRLGSASGSAGPQGWTAVSGSLAAIR